jgi:cell division protein FtsB
MADPQTAKATQHEDTTRSPSGADLVSLLLLILFGFGVWAVVERGFTELLREREPNEQKILDAHGVSKQKAELADVKNESTEIQKYLNAARLEQLKQNAAVQSYIDTYPELANATSPANVPPDVTRAYTEVRRQERSATTVVNSLETRLTALKRQADTLTSELDQKTGPAESQFRRDSFWYAVIKRVGTIVITLAVVAGLVSLVRVLLWKMAARKRMSTVEGFRPLELALAALVLLFAYDQFSFPGAALVGLLLLLILLRRIKWPVKSNVTVK